MIVEQHLIPALGKRRLASLKASEIRTFLKPQREAGLSVPGGTEVARLPSSETSSSSSVSFTCAPLRGLDVANYRLLDHDVGRKGCRGVKCRSGPPCSYRHSACKSPL
jgi:hypothetical protein